MHLFGPKKAFELLKEAASTQPTVITQDGKVCSRMPDEEAATCFSQKMFVILEFDSFGERSTSTSFHFLQKRFFLF